MRAALGGEAAAHDRERALGVGSVDAGGQREVRPQSVVAHPVVEVDVHAQEPLAGAQLVGGHDVGGDAFVAARRAGALIADGPGRERVPGGHDHAGPYRSRLGHDDVDRFGAVDERVDCGR